MKKILYFTNLAPHYRQKLWELLISEKSFEMSFFYGDSLNKSIKEIDYNSKNLKYLEDRLGKLKNRRLKNIIIWQKGVLSKCLFKQADAILLLGDMHIISTWLAAIISRLKGREVIFWGHGFSGAESFSKKKIRILFNKLAHHHLLYGHYAKSLMISYGFNPKQLSVVYNSLDYDSHFKNRKILAQTSKNTLVSFFEQPKLPILLFIGRLTKVKKLQLLLEALKRLNKKKPSFNLLIIGDGEELERLKNQSTKLLINPNVHFLGACYDESILGKYLYHADLCISPGNVGLTAIHCLGHGTPVCTHNNFSNQMPEFEAIEEGITGCFFKENDVEDLVKTINKWFALAIERDKIRKSCFNMIEQKYNPYKQLDIFKSVFNC